jgi:hypothetical protein
MSAYGTTERAQAWGPSIEIPGIMLAETPELYQEKIFTLLVREMHDTCTDCPEVVVA